MSLSKSNRTWRLAALLLAGVVLSLGAAAQEPDPTPTKANRPKPLPESSKARKSPQAPLAHELQTERPIQGPTTSPKESAAMSLPETPQELWSRILVLLQKNKGFTSKQDVEETLGLRFTHSEKDGEKRSLGAKFFHSTKQKIEGFGNISLGMFEFYGLSEPYHPRTKLTVVWWDRQEDRGTKPECLDLEQATRDLDALDWQQAGPVSLAPGGGSRQFFRKEDIAEFKKTGKPSMGGFVQSDAATGASELILWMPNQSSQCVIGFSTDAWHP